MMTEAEREVILQFAQGDQSLRDEAICIHRKHIPTLGVRGSLEQQFMAEVDHPCPDHNLRALYRRKLVNDEHMDAKSFWTSEEEAILDRHSEDEGLMGLLNRLKNKICMLEIVSRVAKRKLQEKGC